MSIGVNNQASKPKYEGYTSPTPATFTEGSSEAEVWLDLVTSALKGYCGAAWQKDKGPINMVSSGIAAKAATEAADTVFAEFKKRCKG